MRPSAELREEILSNIFARSICPESSLDISEIKVAITANILLKLKRPNSSPDSFLHPKGVLINAEYPDLLKVKPSE